MNKGNIRQRWKQSVKKQLALVTEKG